MALVEVECNRADAPRLTPSMRIALADLRLDALRVVYPVTRRRPLSDCVEVVPLGNYTPGLLTHRKPIVGPLWPGRA